MPYDPTPAGDYWNQSGAASTKGAYSPQSSGSYTGADANTQAAQGGQEWGTGSPGGWASNPWQNTAYAATGYSQAIDPKTGKPMKQQSGQSAPANQPPPQSMGDWNGQQYFDYQNGPQFSGQPYQQTANPNIYAAQQFSGPQFNQPSGGSYKATSISAGHISGGGGGGGGGVHAGNISAPKVAGFQRVGLPTANPMADFNYSGTNAQGQFDQATQAAIMAGLQNPSAYNSDVVTGTFNRLNDVMTQKQNEEMAARGLMNSTPAVGRLGDTRAYLAQTLLENQAQQYGQDRAAAIAAATGWSGQQFGQAAQGYGLNQATNAQNFGQQRDIAGLGIQQNSAAAQHALGVGGLQVQAQPANAQNQLAASRANSENAMQRARMNMDAQMANLDAQMKAAGFNAQERQRELESQQFNADLALRGQNQNWNQQFQQFGANAGQLQQNYENQLAGIDSGMRQQAQGFNQNMAGWDANQSATQADFNRRQQLYNNMTGYNQQQWENDYRNQQMAAQLLGQTA